MVKHWEMAWFGEDVKKKVYHASRRGLVKGLEFIKQEALDRLLAMGVKDIKDRYSEQIFFYAVLNNAKTICSEHWP